MNQARLLAFRSLTRSLRDGAFPNLESDQTLRKASLSPEDRSLYEKLYLGVVEKKIPLDYLLSRISQIPLNQLSPEVLSLLELGAFQVLFLDRVPDRAAIFEAGEMAKKHCPQALSYLNAMLRRLSREKETLFSLLDHPGKKGLSLRFGYPKWMVGLWQEAYGKEQCLSIMEAQNQKAALTLRVNTLKISLSEYEQLLKKEEIPYHANPLCRNGFTLETKGHPSQLPGFEEGLFFVQDAAAQRAVDRLGARPGERILDLCAAPGGKSFGAAMDMEGQGEILSFELHASRLDLIQKGARRLGISIIRAQKNDSTQLLQECVGIFDRVICDVPCSGYGVIAKKPDIRHKEKEEAAGLPELQLAILESGATALKAGGVILYSTCTLNPEENEGVTEKFLSRHPQFRRIGKAETIFPVGGENDGFFCDLLEKTI